jgi:hypothetical protein
MNMAKFMINPKVAFETQLTLSESETRALDALAGYGADEFIQRFYSHLGETYMKSHEQGLRDFLGSIRGQLPVQLAKIDAARKSLLSPFVSE